jgi:short-chain fatty acids transporter
MVMSASGVFVRLFRKVLPSPFAIALILSAISLVLAMVFGTFESGVPSWKGTLISWERGLWNPGLLVFAYQMMLILVLGHVVVLSKPFEILIGGITKWVTNGASAAGLVAIVTMLVAFFNWGLGLVFGAILARKVGEYASQNNIPINYPLIGACGYLGLLVFNGGISGSAALKASEPGHLTDLMRPSTAQDLMQFVPNRIPTADTIFHPSNLVVSVLLLLILGGFAYWLGKRTPTTKFELPEFSTRDLDQKILQGAEKLDHSPGLALGFGMVLLAGFFMQYLPELKLLNLTPNMLNLFMLALGVLLHGNIYRFQRAVSHAISGASGILIQFPLYFGIMGVMSGSGLIGAISDYFVSIADADSYPFFTFLSAGLVNIFIPSGGGQWAVQGPVIMQAALQLNVPLSKALMALAYGDQLTNMMQPFWALPLLGITRLKASDILPYSLLFMLVGGLIFVLGLFFW